MNDRPSDPIRAKAALATALRAARAEDAERAGAIADLRALAIARLEVLRDALDPVLAQIPPEVDLFDVALMPGDPPRLFIDMIAFVEMNRDRRAFQFFQDRRDGRVMLAETATLDATVDAVTAYLARRLVERDKALAATDSGPALPHPKADRLPRARERGPAVLREGSWLHRMRESLQPRGLGEAGLGPWYAAGQAFWFVVEVLGLLALLGLLLFGVRSLILLTAMALAGQN